jgi:hypothetical protein
MTDCPSAPLFFAPLRVFANMCHLFPHMQTESLCVCMGGGGGAGTDPVTNVSL